MKSYVHGQNRRRADLDRKLANCTNEVTGMKHIARLDKARGLRLKVRTLEAEKVRRKIQKPHGARRRELARLMKKGRTLHDILAGRRAHAVQAS